MKYFVIILLMLIIWCVKGSIAQNRQNGPYTAEQFCDTTEINEIFTRAYKSNPIKGNLRGYGNDSAIILYKEALDCCIKLLEKQDLYICAKKKMATIYWELGMNYGAGNRDEKIIAIDYFKKALTVYEELSDINSEIKTLHWLGSFFSRDKQEKEYYFDKALRLAYESEDKNLIVDNLIRRGSEVNNTDTARYYYFKALKIAEEFWPEKKMDIYEQIAFSYEKERKYSLARDFYFKEIEMAEEFYWQISLTIFEDIGDTYYAEGNFSLAREYYLKQLNHDKKTGMVLGEAKMYRDIANTYMSERNYPKAIEILSEGNLKCESIYKSIGKIDLVKQVFVLEPLTKSYFLLASSLKKSDIDKNKYYLKAILSMKEVTQLSKEIQDTSLVLLILNYRNELFTKFNIKENINKPRYKKNGHGHFEINNDFVNDLGVLKNLNDSLMNYYENKDTIKVPTDSKGDIKPVTGDLTVPKIVKDFWNWKIPAPVVIGSILLIVLLIYVMYRSRTQMYRSRTQLLKESLHHLRIKQIATIELLKHMNISAFARVNARTTSHNTGSHVLTNSLYGYKKQDMDNFHRYLRQRMLYNSDITSGVSSFESEYCLEYVFNEFTKITIIKKFISGKKDIEFAGFCAGEDVKEKKASFPNGILGIHALFIIFENIIRNYYKHVRDATNELRISVTINHETDEYICLGLSDNSIPSEDQFSRITGLISESINNNLLRSEGLGLVEMKGACCYINKIPIENIDAFDEIQINQDEKRKVFRAIRNSKGELEYEIWLRKPQTALIYSDEISWDNDTFKRNGIYRKSVFGESINEPHKWVIIEKRDILTSLISKLNTISNKVSLFNENNKKDYLFPILDIGDIDKIKKNPGEINTFLYQKWRKCLISRKGIINSEINIIKQDESTCGKTIITKQKKYKNLWKDGIAGSSQGIINIIYAAHVDSKKWLASDFYYYEPYSSAIGVTGTLVSNLDIATNWFPDELFESAITEIVILDERIQRFSANPVADPYIIDNTVTDNKISILEFLKKMKIYIPLKTELDLNSTSLEEKQIGDWVAQKKKTLDYFIIHLALIEQFLVKKDKPDIWDWIACNIFPNLDQKYGTTIILTSERGTPKNVPDQCRYVHYSNLERSLLEEPSKIEFTNLLFNSRKTSN